MENKLVQQKDSKMLLKDALEKSKALSFFENKKKMLVSEITNKLTVQDAVNSGAHFSSLRKWDEKFVVFSVATMLSELLGYVPNNLTEDQVVSIAESIVLDCEN